MRTNYFFSCLISLLLISACTESDKNYSISGTVSNIDDEKAWVVLSQFNPITQKANPIDTAYLDTEGNYKLEYPWTQPDLYRLNFPGRQSVILAVDKGQYQVTVDAEGKRNGSLTIAGSSDSEKLLAYDAFRKESNERLIRPPYSRMREAGKEGNVEAEVDAVMEYVVNSKTHRKELLDFTEENIGTSIALYGSALRWTGDDEVGRLEKLVSAFEKEHPDLEMASEMREKVERYKKVAIGAAAPAIAGKDEKGFEVTLAQSIGKVTLIDFWASWCGPCISQVPDLQEAYTKFADQGFEIVSISVDRNEQKWIDAIDRLDLKWKHISDVKGWQSELAKAYNVTFIPFNFLLDENGVIIHKNLHSKVLQNTLQELFAAEAS